MAQFYTLEESAQRLGMPADEFKRRLRTESAFTAIRPFRDGPTLRFRAADIDELARSLGEASDPGFPLGPVGTPAADESDELPIALTPEPPKAKPKAKPKGHDEPIVVADDDVMAAGRRHAKSDSDSDVRLDLAPAASARVNDPNMSQPTEEIAFDLAGPGSAVIKPSGLSGKRPAAGGPGSGKVPSPAGGAGDSSSEFELSVDPESDSFEYQLTTDSSDEVDLGGLALAPDKKGGQSGINLGKPADSGVSLEGKSSKTGPLGKKPPADDSDVDFELSLDPAGPSSNKLRGTSGPSSNKLAGPRSGVHRKPAADSDSEFELSLDDNSGVADSLAASLQPGSQGDIFETDFELPAMDDNSGGEIVAVDAEASEEFEVDIDLAEVEELDAAEVALDEAEVVDDGPRVGRRRGVADDDLDDLEDGPSASKQLRGVRARGDSDELTDRRTVAVEAPPARWGAFPAVVLFLTLPLLFIGTLMSYEVLRGMWGYHQPTPPGSLIVRGLASELGMKTGD